MTLVELKELVKELGLDDNAKVVLLVGKVGENNYQIIKVDANGRLVITT
jgi:hypothetical protein